MALQLPMSDGRAPLSELEDRSLRVGRGRGGREGAARAKESQGNMAVAVAAAVPAAAILAALVAAAMTAVTVAATVTAVVAALVAATVAATVAVTLTVIWGGVAYSSKR